MAQRSQVRTYREMNRQDLETIARNQDIENISDKSSEELIQELDYHARPRGGSDPSAPGREGGKSDTSPIKGTNPGQWQDAPGKRG